jgi:hypothetical protein
MFASKITASVTVKDGETDGIVVIKKLSASRLDEARRVRQLAFFATAKAMGGDVLRAVRELPEDEVKAVQERTAAVAPTPEQRYAPFDRTTVLRAGIASWTFQLPCNASNIDDLDEPSAEQLFHAIVDLSVPAEDPKVAEENRAKD